MMSEREQVMIPQQQCLRNISSLIQGRCSLTWLDGEAFAEARTRQLNHMLADTG
jgi:hypothetical protein